jgi:glycine/D-amino acid oxidase-like deaminating enzyme
MAHENSQTTLVLGGGPAGLTAGYLLGRHDRDVVVLEAEDQVGGLAKTVERDGYRFDLGGHRFFTKAMEVDNLWHEVLGDEFLRRPRMSRIYWNNRYLDHPGAGLHRDEHDEEHLQQDEEPVPHVGHPEPVDEDGGGQPDPPHGREHHHDPTDARGVVQVGDRRAEHQDGGDEHEVVEQLDPYAHLFERVRGDLAARFGHRVARRSA